MKAQITLDVTAEELALLSETAWRLSKYEWYAMGKEIHEISSSQGGYVGEFFDEEYAQLAVTMHELFRQLVETDGMSYRIATPSV